MYETFAELMAARGELSDLADELADVLNVRPPGRLTRPIYRKGGVTLQENGTLRTELYMATRDAPVVSLATDGVWVAVIAVGTMHEFPRPMATVDHVASFIYETLGAPGVVLR